MTNFAVRSSLSPARVYRGQVPGGGTTFAANRGPNSSAITMFVSLEARPGNQKRFLQWAKRRAGGGPPSEGVPAADHT